MRATRVRSLQLELHGVFLTRWQSAAAAPRQSSVAAAGLDGSRALRGALHRKVLRLVEDVRVGLGGLWCGATLGRGSARTRARRSGAFHRQLFQVDRLS